MHTHVSTGCKYRHRCIVLQHIKGNTVLYGVLQLLDLDGSTQLLHGEGGAHPNKVLQLFRLGRHRGVEEERVPEVPVVPIVGEAHVHGLALADRPAQPRHRGRVRGLRLQEAM